MLRSITLATLAALTSAAMAAPMTDGSYKGHGRWKSADGQSGAYDVATTVKDGVISNTYDFNGKSKSFTMEAKLDSKGFFPVLINGTIVGNGYCQSVQCHYRLDSGMEETLTFDQGHLYRLGSKTENGKTITWEEALDSVE